MVRMTTSTVTANAGYCDWSYAVLVFRTVTVCLGFGRVNQNFAPAPSASQNRAMLCSPEAHEPLAAEPWSEARARSAVAAITAEVEEAFDDGWSTHPQDVVEPADATRRFRTVYLGGAGVVDALHRLARRGFAELRRDYAIYLERSLAALPDFPDEDSERSLWMGETGIRLVLQRLAPTAENRDR